MSTNGDELRPFHFFFAMERNIGTVSAPFCVCVCFPSSLTGKLFKRSSICCAQRGPSGWPSSRRLYIRPDPFPFFRRRRLVEHVQLPRVGAAVLEVELIFILRQDGTQIDHAAVAGGADNPHVIILFEEQVDPGMGQFGTFGIGSCPDLVS